MRTNHRWILLFLTLLLFTPSTVDGAASGYCGHHPEARWGLTDRMKTQLESEIPHLIHWVYEWGALSLPEIRDPVVAMKAYRETSPSKSLRIEVVTDGWCGEAYSFDLGVSIGFEKGEDEVFNYSAGHVDPAKIPAWIQEETNEALDLFRKHEKPLEDPLSETALIKMVRHTLYVSLGQDDGGRATMENNRFFKKLIDELFEDEVARLAPGRNVELVIPAFREFDPYVYCWTRFDSKGYEATLLIASWMRGEWIKGGSFVGLGHKSFSNSDYDDFEASEKDLFFREFEEDDWWKRIFKNAYLHLLVGPDGRVFQIPAVGGAQPVTWRELDWKKVTAAIKNPSVTEFKRQPLAKDGSVSGPKQ